LLMTYKVVSLKEGVLKEEVKTEIL